jgi:hypothetical protein
MRTTFGIELMPRVLLPSRGVEIGLLVYLLCSWLWACVAPAGDEAAGKEAHIEYMLAVQMHRHGQQV